MNGRRNSVWQEGKKTKVINIFKVHEIMEIHGLQSPEGTRHIAEDFPGIRSEGTLSKSYIPFRKKVYYLVKQNFPVILLG